MTPAAIEDEQTPDQDIRGLRSVTPTDHPFVDEPWGEDYGPIFTRFAHALADFLHDAPPHDLAGAPHVDLAHGGQRREGGAHHARGAALHWCTPLRPHRRGPRHNGTLPERGYAPGPELTRPLGVAKPATAAWRHAKPRPQWTGAFVRHDRRVDIPLIGPVVNVGLRLLDRQRIKVVGHLHDFPPPADDRPRFELEIEVRGKAASIRSVHFIGVPTMTIGYGYRADQRHEGEAMWAPTPIFGVDIPRLQDEETVRWLFPLDVAGPIPDEGRHIAIRAVVTTTRGKKHYSNEVAYFDGLDRNDHAAKLAAFERWKGETGRHGIDVHPER